MSFQYSMPDRLSRATRQLGAAAGVAVSERAKIHERCDYEPSDINPGDRKSAVDQPGVDERCERQKYEADDEEQEALKGAIQVVGEKEEED